VYQATQSIGGIERERVDPWLAETALRLSERLR
jgi:hypothetical protein